MFWCREVKLGDMRVPGCAVTETIGGFISAESTQKEKPNHEKIGEKGKIMNCCDVRSTMM